eukprot:496364_1
MGSCSTHVPPDNKLYIHYHPKFSHSPWFDRRNCLFMNEGNYINIKCATNPSFQSWKWAHVIQTNEASGHVKVKYQLYDDSFNNEWLYLDDIQFNTSVITNIIIYGFIRNFQMNNNLFMGMQSQIHEYIITYCG